MNVALNLRENWRIYTELDCEKTALDFNRIQLEEIYI